MFLEIMGGTSMIMIYDFSVLVFAPLLLNVVIKSAESVTNEDAHSFFHTLMVDTADRGCKCRPF